MLWHTVVQPPSTETQARQAGPGVQTLYTSTVVLASGIQAAQGVVLVVLVVQMVLVRMVVRV